MSGAPTSVSDVRRRRTTGSPTGREPQGDGAVIVVGGRESRPQGEGRQVPATRGMGGRRNADGRNIPNVNHCCGMQALESWVRGKLACPVRRGADGKGPGNQYLAGGLPYLIASEAHLQRVLAAYTDFYNRLGRTRASTSAARSRFPHPRGTGRCAAAINSAACCSTTTATPREPLRPLRMRSPHGTGHQPLGNRGGCPGIRPSLARTMGRVTTPRIPDSPYDD